MKKTISILLSATLLLSILAGCSGKNDPNATPVPTAEPSGAVTEHDFAKAQAAYDMDKVVMTVNGSEVTWDEFFYYLYSSIMYFEQQLGPIADFTQTIPGNDSMSYSQLVVQYAADMATQFHVMAVNTVAAGVELDEEDKAELQEVAEQDKIGYCGQDATDEDFDKYLESNYANRSIYDFVTKAPYLLMKCFETMYGEDGGLLPDEDVEAFISDYGYMSCKHILILTRDAEGAELTDEQKAEKQAKAQELYEQFAAISDQAALVQKFDELMNEYSEDTGLPYNPDGYTFTSGEMVAEFETATKELEEYAVSEPVESSYGYHIILRLPTTQDSRTMDNYTMRYLAALNLYNVMVGNWFADADVVWTPEFENLDVAALL